MTSTSQSSVDGGLGGLQRGGHHPAVGDEGDVLARPPHDRPVDRRAFRRQHGGLLRPVAPLRLEEDDRVRAADRLAQQAVGVGRGARRHHAQARGVRVVRLRGVAVVLDAADAAAERHPDDHGQRELAPRPVAQLGEVAGDLLEGGVGERVELHLDDRDEAVHRHADGGADDAGLGERRVEDPVLAEAAGQPVGDAEDPAERADVLAEDDDAVVGGQAVGQGPVERGGHGDLRRARGRRGLGCGGLAGACRRQVR